LNLHTLAYRPVRDALPHIDAAFANLKSLQRADLYQYRGVASLPRVVATMLEIICSTS